MGRNGLCQRMALAVMLLSGLGTTCGQSVPDACEQYVLTNAYADAIQACDQFRRTLSPVTQADEYTTASLRLATSYSALGDYDAATKVLNDLEGAVSDRLSIDQRYRLLRRRGAVLFHQEHHGAAIEAFEDALLLAQRMGDSLKQGKSHNDLGAAYRAQGLFNQSLEHLLESLALKREENDFHAIGTTINNIGNVYRDMGEYSSALEQYDEAIAVFEKDLIGSNDQRAKINIAHTLENIGLSYAALGDGTAARESLEQSLQRFAEFQRVKDQFRLHVSLSSTLLDQQELAAANTQLARARQLAEDHKLGLSLAYWASLTRFAEMQQQPDDMLVAAQSGYDQATAAGNDLRRAEFAAYKATALAEQGDFTSAYQWLQQHRELEQQIASARFDEAVAKNRAIYDLQRREEQISLLQKDLQIERLHDRQRLIVIIVFVLVLAAVVSVLWRRRSAQQKIMQRQIENHREREANLKSSYARLDAALDATDEPIAVVDQTDHLVQANSAFLRETDMRMETAPASLSNIFPDLMNSQEYRALSESHPDCEINTVMDRQDQRVPVTIACLLQSDGSVVMSLRTASGEEKDRTRASFLASLKQLEGLKNRLSILQHRLDRLPGDAPDRGDVLNELEDISRKLDSVLDQGKVDDVDQRYRSMLVSIMQNALDAWEVATGESKLELAEQSGIWRVSIDDGRLRTRSMDRYFQLQKLPANPRWREVLRTAHFVLGHCTLSEDRRKSLREMINRFEVLQQAML